ncbi:hypothetical protein K461DRAFT_290526 [Myriangium duriaei CBS 260.36]|uniref:DUF1566 domain-containing protein n=1 Tax=Myriangium duriaei CBS 260.36 TaxID=1168546 RepID=A0A9P4J4X7_9PEZI|nr:hypothetical protein K461DRAFT_290526 [Myriangium duriaei CBS 260.36]
MRLTVTTLATISILLHNHAFARPTHGIDEGFYLRLSKRYALPPSGILVEPVFDPEIDGLYVNACNFGSGKSYACVERGVYGFFHFNVTGEQESLPSSVAALGKLTYHSTAANKSQAMGLAGHISSDESYAGFGLESVERKIGFRSESKMGIANFYNDTADPPTRLQKPTFAWNWYVCDAEAEGHVYRALTWVHGNVAPTQPSCKGVLVTRIYK